MDYDYCRRMQFYSYHYWLEITIDTSTAHIALGGLEQHEQY
jgi:hypothetical protein